jgi:hypothetical protein
MSKSRNTAVPDADSPQSGPSDNANRRELHRPDVPGYRNFLSSEGRPLRKTRNRPETVFDGPDTPMASEVATRAYDAVVDPPIAQLPIQLAPNHSGPVRFYSLSNKSLILQLIKPQDESAIIVDNEPSSATNSMVSESSVALSPTSSMPKCSRPPETNLYPPLQLRQCLHP